eukprot:gnl/TRDRNA2_/TRDRNA2_172179_c0_seq11.p1 gnl/TRDRNA2_/TRDRNA2_172179_c0~~gnl/TRDRNA2_/TRDRNA2_172179_c0_seq11.p1  ORF type:complete len:117 (-),score=4.36 gnl/TRDRNA2_/TRDRNA2_172179_c0_seq11:49-399(-)
MILYWSFWSTVSVMHIRQSVLLTEFLMFRQRRRISQRGSDITELCQPQLHVTSRTSALKTADFAGERYVLTVASNCLNATVLNHALTVVSQCLNAIVLSSVWGLKAVKMPIWHFES